MAGIPVLVLLNGDVSRQVGEPFWHMQREYRDVTYVCRWLMEVDGAQPQTSTVNSPEGSLGESCPGGKQARRVTCPHSKKRRLQRLQANSVPCCWKAQGDRAQKCLLILCPQKHCDIRRMVGLNLGSWTHMVFGHADSSGWGHATGT